MVIDPDEFKKIAGDYNSTNHDIYAKQALQLYDRALKEVKNPVVRFTAGGSGSGKSELLLSRLTRDFDGIVVDGTLGNYEGTMKRIAMARKAGKKVEITAVLPRIESAWKFVQKRELETGRGVPLQVFIEAHTGFVDSLKRLAKAGYEIRLKDTRNVFTMKDAENVPFIGGQKEILAVLDKVGYNKENLLKKLSHVKLTQKSKREIRRQIKRGEPIRPFSR